MKPILETMYRVWTGTIIPVWTDGARLDKIVSLRIPKYVNDCAKLLSPGVRLGGSIRTSRDDVQLRRGS